jgi:hypothetical protein
LLCKEDTKTARKKKTLGTGQSPFSLSCSLERSELSNMFFLDSSQPCNLRHGTWNCSSSVQRLISREAELASKSPPAEGSIATWAVLAQPCVPACSSPALRPPMLFGALRLLIITSLPRASEPHLRRCSSPHRSSAITTKSLLFSNLVEERDEAVFSGSILCITLASWHLQLIYFG